MTVELPQQLCGRVSSLTFLRGGIQDPRKFSPDQTSVVLSRPTDASNASSALQATPATSALQLSRRFLLPNGGTRTGIVSHEPLDCLPVLHVRLGRTPDLASSAAVLKGVSSSSGAAQESLRTQPSSRSSQPCRQSRSRDTCPSETSEHTSPHLRAISSLLPRSRRATHQRDS